ncbi:OsmC family protein [Rickettsiales bacterium]|nr:OsmC family protein [Rickettsiales bacterium]
MSEDKVITAHIEETGKNDYAVKIEVSGHHLHGDEPKSFGGGNTGPAPYDMLLAALGECTAMTVRWYAIQQKWPLEKVEVTLTHQKVEKVDKFEKKITIHGDALTDEQRKKLIEVAAKCPVQRTLEGKVEITTV